MHPADRDRRAHLRIGLGGKQQDTQKEQEWQGTTQSQGRELGGHGSPMMSNPGPGGSQPWQARLAELLTTLPPLSLAANLTGA